MYHIDGECGDLEGEMVVFPKGANDDTLDSLAMQNDIAESPIDEYKQAVMKHQRAQRAERVAKNYGLK